MLRVMMGLSLSLLVLVTFSAPADAFRDSIVAAWTFDNGAGNAVADVSGNGNAGEVLGSADWVAGKFDQALHFDGSTGYIEIPFDDSINLLNQSDFTIAAWFLIDEAPNENKEIFQQGDSNGTGRTWLFVAADSEIRSFLGNGTTGSGVMIVPGEWFHTAVVVTETGATDEIQLYVNGEPAGEVGLRGMEDSEGSFFIGVHKNLTNFWPGMIDEVVLTNRGLDQGEVQALMNAGAKATLAVNMNGKIAMHWGAIKELP